MSIIFGLIIGALIGILFSALLIWIVGKLGWGMTVTGFGPAFITALVVGILNVIASIVWAAFGIQQVSIPTHTIVTAGFLYYAGSRIKGLTVKSFWSALVASLAIAGLTWLANWIVGSLA